ncbi:MAG: hypothetical protein E6G42_01790 [Actinobacteria bacterium]|nr:MAG: hypothetical protein E6G42_01790 [Actinomycetota bacterium]
MHVADCGVERPDDTEAAPEAEYEKVSRTIEALLARPDEQTRLRTAAARYFDEHAAPGRVAEYVLGLVER